MHPINDLIKQAKALRPLCRALTTAPRRLTTLAFPDA